METAGINRILEYAVFCVENVARRLNCNPAEVYKSGCKKNARNCTFLKKTKNAPKTQYYTLFGAFFFGKIGETEKFLVDPRGVEPLSESRIARASPSAVYVLTFPLSDSHRQDSDFSSFINSHRPQSLRRLVPCLYHAGGLRRRRLRVDERG